MIKYDPEDLEKEIMLERKQNRHKKLARINIRLASS